MSETANPAAARPGVMSLNISSKSALYAAYMPFLQNGGLFLPTQKPYRLGDEIFVLLQLPDDTARHAVATTVAWVTPPGAQAGKTQGVGLHFSADDAGKSLRNQIEKTLAGLLGASRPTHTL